MSVLKQLQRQLGMAAKQMVADAEAQPNTVVEQHGVAVKMIRDGVWMVGDVRPNARPAASMPGEAQRLLFAKLMDKAKEHGDPEAALAAMQ